VVPVCEVVHRGIRSRAGCESRTRPRCLRNSDLPGRNQHRATTEGIEPSSLGLTGPCSATELRCHRSGVRNRTPADLVNSEVPSHRAPPEKARSYRPARRTYGETACAHSGRSVRVRSGDVKEQARALARLRWGGGSRTLASRVRAASMTVMHPSAFASCAERESNPRRVGKSHMLDLRATGAHPWDRRALNPHRAT
jgi:hypothetical protein